MLKKLYNLSASKIKPEQELIENTEKRMREEIQRKQNSPFQKLKLSFYHRRYTSGMLTAGFLLVFLVSYFIPTQKKSIDKQENLNNLGSSILDSSGIPWIASSDPVLDSSPNSFSENPESNAVIHPKQEEESVLTDDTESIMEDKSKSHDPAQSLPLEEAYASPYGSYIPQDIPQNLPFLNASLSNLGTEQENFFILFTDYSSEFRLSIRHVEQVENYQNRIIDLEKPEAYDITLYEIPYADSIPDKLRDSVLDPIIPEKNLTEELLSKRIVTVKESTESYQQASFSILFGDLLVSYSFKAKGLDGDYLLQVIRSAEYFAQ